MKAKSPSQRLRSALFILHEKKGVEQDFEEWYAEMIEQFIKRVKKAIKDYEQN
jgi:NADH:ubiquinone oxidoreductase subunit D